MAGKITKVNERGSHTSTIEKATDILRFLKKAKIEVSPGKIEVINAKSQSVKFNHINSAVSEMTIASGRSKQTFKVFEDADILFKLFKVNQNKFVNWNINSSR